MTDPIAELDELEREVDLLMQRGQNLPELEFEAAMKSISDRIMAVKQRRSDQSYASRYANMLEEEKQMITQRTVRRGAEQPEYYTKTPYWGIDPGEQPEELPEEEDEFLEEW
jgi:hypothetical protein